jgi:hypothetical protein
VGLQSDVYCGQQMSPLLQPLTHSTASADAHCQVSQVVPLAEQSSPGRALSPLQPPHALRAWSPLQ